MNISVVAEVISGSAAVIVAALSYLFTKAKEREADWRKWKCEQYKEFITTLSGIVGRIAAQKNEAAFIDASNTLNLIGSQRVLQALGRLIDSFNAQKPPTEQNNLLSALIREIRRDLGTPGKLDAHEFSARMWYGRVEDRKE